MVSPNTWAAFPYSAYSNNFYSGPLSSGTTVSAVTLPTLHDFLSWSQEVLDVSGERFLSALGIASQGCCSGQTTWCTVGTDSGQRSVQLTWGFDTAPVPSDTESRGQNICDSASERRLEGGREAGLGSPGQTDANLQHSHTLFISGWGTCHALGSSDTARHAKQKNQTLPLKRENKMSMQTIRH